MDGTWNLKFKGHPPLFMNPWKVGSQLNGHVGGSPPPTLRRYHQWPHLTSASMGTVEGNGRGWPTAWFIWKWTKRTRWTHQKVQRHTFSYNNFCQSISNNHKWYTCNNLFCDVESSRYTKSIDTNRVWARTIARTSVLVPESKKRCHINVAEFWLCHEFRNPPRNESLENYDACPMNHFSGSMLV